MQIAQRSFLIPENPSEIALCQHMKNMRKIRLSYKDREFSVWTDEDEDKMLVHQFLRMLDKRFYYEAIVLDKDLDPKRLANYIVIKVCPEIIIDIRKNPAVGYNFDFVKGRLELNNISYRWIPLLGQKGHLKDGLFEVNQLLKNYRRLCFVGTREKRLNKICRLLRKANKVI